jgi:transcriptional regulator with XRE-family HTH domain
MLDGVREGDESADRELGGRAYRELGGHADRGRREIEVADEVEDEEFDGEEFGEFDGEEFGEFDGEEFGEFGEFGEFDGDEFGEPQNEEPGAPSGWVVNDGRRIGVALRSSRRRLGWNQRELAHRAGLHQATIARLEAGADARFSVVVSALSACGLDLVATPPPGAPTDWRVVPDPMDEGRDTAGRRLPAHLPAYATDALPTYTLWKRMVRGEDLLAARPPHWLYAREPWPVPPEPADPAPRPPTPDAAD